MNLTPASLEAWYTERIAPRHCFENTRIWCVDMERALHRMPRRDLVTLLCLTLRTLTRQPKRPEAPKRSKVRARRRRKPNARTWKLTDAQKRVIRTARPGVSDAALARRFGVSAPAVSYLRKRKNPLKLTHPATS